MDLLSSSNTEKPHDDPRSRRKFDLCSVAISDFNKNILKFWLNLDRMGIKIEILYKKIENNFRMYVDRFKVSYRFNLN